MSNDEGFENLGILEVVRKSGVIKITRAVKSGTVTIERDEGKIIPRREFTNAFNELKNVFEECFFAANARISVDEITKISFSVGKVSSEDGICDEMFSVKFKGAFTANYEAEFTTERISDADVIGAAKVFYREAALYFDGKNAQTELPLTEEKVAAVGAKYGITNKAVIESATKELNK